MDLRSAHKTPEKPPPRLRLSLTRSLLPEDDHQPYRQGSQTQRSHHRSKQRREELRCLDSNPPSPTQENWEEQVEDEEEEEESSTEDDEDRGEEEEREEAQKDAAKKRNGILNGMCVSWSASGF